MRSKMEERKLKYVFVFVEKGAPTDKGYLREILSKACPEALVCSPTPEIYRVDHHRVEDEMAFVYSYIRRQIEEGKLPQIFEEPKYDLPTWEGTDRRYGVRLNVVTVYGI